MYKILSNKFENPYTLSLSPNQLEEKLDAKLTNFKDGTLMISKDFSGSDDKEIIYKVTEYLDEQGESYQIYPPTPCKVVLSLKFEIANKKTNEKIIVGTFYYTRPEYIDYDGDLLDQVIQNTIKVSLESSYGILWSPMKIKRFLTKEEANEYFRSGLAETHDSISCDFEDEINSIETVDIAINQTVKPKSYKISIFLRTTVGNEQSIKTLIPSVFKPLNYDPKCINLLKGFNVIS